MARGNFYTETGYFRSTTLPTFPYTIAGWFYLPASMTSGAVAGVQDEGGSRDMTGVFATGAGPVVFQAYELNGGGTGGSVATATSNLNSLAWNHFCGVFDGDASRTIYFNGGNSATNTTNNGANQSLYDSIILGGRNIGGSQYVDGYLAEMGVWDVALSADDIASLAKGFSCHLVRQDALLHHIPGVRSDIFPVGDMAATDPIGTFPHPPIIGALPA